MSILADVITPTVAVEQLRSAGVVVSERKLREHARAIGAYRLIGKSMFFTTADLTKIIDAAQPEPKKCQNSRSGGKSGTIPSPWTESDTEALLARVTGGSRKISRQKQTGPRVVQLPTAQKRS